MNINDHFDSYIIERNKCPRCGIRIYHDHGAGGYIDHVENFADNSYYRSRPAEELAEDICFDQNSLRGEKDIKERLECFITWDYPIKEKQIVFFTVVKVLEKLRAYKDAAQMICNASPNIVIALLKDSNKNDAFISLFNECYEEATKENGYAKDI